MAYDILDVTASSEDLDKTAGKDETTYPKLLELEESKACARVLIDEAKECVEPFGERAAPCFLSQTLLWIERIRMGTS